MQTRFDITEIVDFKDNILAIRNIANSISSDYQNEANSLGSTINHAITDVSQARRMLEKSGHELDGINHELDELAIRLREMINRLETRISQIEAEANVVRRQIDGLIAQIDAANAELATLQPPYSVTTTDSEGNSSTTYHDPDGARRNALNSLISRLSSQVDSLRQKLSAILNEINRFNIILNDNRRRLARVNSQISTNNAVISEVNAHQAKLGRLQSSLGRAVDKLNDYNRTFATFNNSMANVSEAVIVRMSRTINAAEKYLRLLNPPFKKASTNADTLHSATQLYENVIPDISDRISRFGSASEGLSSWRDAVRQRNDQFVSQSILGIKKTAKNFEQITDVTRKAHEYIIEYINSIV